MKERFKGEREYSVKIVIDKDGRMGVGLGPDFQDPLKREDCAALMSRAIGMLMQGIGTVEPTQRAKPLPYVERFTVAECREVIKVKPEVQRKANGKPIWSEDVGNYAVALREAGSTYQQIAEHLDIKPYLVTKYMRLEADKNRRMRAYKMMRGEINP